MNDKLKIFTQTDVPVLRPGQVALPFNIILQAVRKFSDRDARVNKLMFTKYWQIFGRTISIAFRKCPIEFPHRFNNCRYVRYWVEYTDNANHVVQFALLVGALCPVPSCPVLSLFRPVLSCSVPVPHCLVLFCPVPSCLVLFCPRSVLSCPVLSLFCPVLFRPVLSCPVLSCPVLSCPVLSCPVLSYPILSYPILFYTILFYLNPSKN